MINFAIELAVCLIWWCVFLPRFCEALSSTQHHNCWRALARVAVLPFVLYPLFFQVAGLAAYLLRAGKPFLSADIATSFDPFNVVVVMA